MSFRKSGHFYITAGRIVAHALQNIRRNLGLAVVTIMILVLSLISVDALLTVRELTVAAVKAVEQQVDLSIFFTPESSAEQIAAVQKFVSVFPEVTRVDFLSREQALATFRERHKASPEILKSLEILDENPLGAIMVIHTKDTGDYKKIMAALSAKEFETIIQRRSFEERGQVVERVEAWTARAQQFSLWLAVLFCAIAILIVFNTIRVAIYTQREEISIKKLVGATNGFIRAPFFVEGFIYVAVAAAIITGLIALAARVIDPLLGPMFVDGGFSINKLFFVGWQKTLAVEFSLTLLIVWATAWFAMRRHLRT